MLSIVLLGYGKSRYNPKEMDGKKSLVSKAANMAAAKGMLVCNSMGNEGMDRAWRVLITPADADSVLSVGGIEPGTNEHINFSSYGPTYDGRLKPMCVGVRNGSCRSSQRRLYFRFRNLFFESSGCRFCCVCLANPTEL